MSEEVSVQMFSPGELNAILDTVPTIMKSAEQQLIERFIEDSKNEAPVKTGALRDNIYANIANEYDISAGSNVDYWYYAYAGTIYQNANPFFDRGYDIRLS